MVYTIQILTASPHDPHKSPPLGANGPSEDTSTIQKQADVKLTDSTPTVQDWLLDFMQNTRFLGARLGWPEVTTGLNPTISTRIPYIW